MPGKLTAAQVDDLIRRYEAGETQGQLATAFGISQGSVSRWVIKRGANISRGDVMSRRMAALSPDERLALASKAQEARRGMVDADEVVAARAVGRQRTLSQATAEERAIALQLPDAVLQQAVGRYNVDIAVAPVAVELFGGAWHAHGAHADRMPQRMRYLADRGWNVLIVWTHTVHPLNVRVVAQHALAYLERSRRDPSFRRQYRVIWGDGQVIAAGSLDDDKLTFIPTGIRGTYARRG